MCNERSKNLTWACNLYHGIFQNLISKTGPSVNQLTSSPRGTGQSTWFLEGCTHEQEDDVGSHGGELDGAGVNGLHQDVTVLVPLVNVPGLALDDILLQHRHNLQEEAELLTISKRLCPLGCNFVDLELLKCVKNGASFCCHRSRCFARCSGHKLPKWIGTIPQWMHAAPTPEFVDCNNAAGSESVKMSFKIILLVSLQKFTSCASLQIRDLPSWLLWIVSMINALTLCPRILSKRAIARPKRHHRPTSQSHW